MSNTIPFRIIAADGALVDEGNRTSGGEVVVNRANGQRLYEWVDDNTDGGNWVERGAYAGPGAIETAPKHQRIRIMSNYGLVRDGDIVAGGTVEPGPGEWVEYVREDCACGCGRAAAGCGCDDCLALTRTEISTSGQSDQMSGKSDTILQEAQAIVYGVRETMYGHPVNDFARTALMWTAYLRACGIIQEHAALAAAAVPDMMELLKIARGIGMPPLRDNYVDRAGYAAAAARAVGVDR